MNLSSFETTNSGTKHKAIIKLISCTFGNLESILREIFLRGLTPHELINLSGYVNFPLRNKSSNSLISHCSILNSPNDWSNNNRRTESKLL